MRIIRLIKLFRYRPMHGIGDDEEEEEDEEEEMSGGLIQASGTGGDGSGWDPDIGFE